MSDICVHELARLRPQLVRFARSRLRDRHQAEDAVQETLLAALEGRGGFAAGSSLRTWVIGILKHKIVDSMRASGREVPLDPENEPVHETGPEDRLARRRLVEALGRGLQRLPANAARAFLLREAIGMDTAEVCKELAISSSNCWVMLHRARKRLRECQEIRGLAADAL